MKVDQSKALNKGTRVYWRGDAADMALYCNELGCSYDRLEKWTGGRVHHGDMREIQQKPKQLQAV